MTPIPHAPSQEEGLRLHQALLEREATAPSELAEAYLLPLWHWLMRLRPNISEQECCEAAGEALLQVIRNPSSYDPERGELLPYLRLSAQRDLSNILRRERRHQRHRQSWVSVEDSASGGKYSEEDDPSFRLRLAEAESLEDDPVLKGVVESLDETDLRIFELMQGGERSTAVYAEVLGCADALPIEQERQVKRYKDKIKQRIKRAREKYDQPHGSSGTAGEG